MYSVDENDPFEVRVGDITLHLLTQKVRFKNKEMDLWRVEYQLLEYLALRGGSPIQIGALTDHLPGSDVSPDAVRVTLSRIRSRLGDEGERYLPHGGSIKGYTLQAPT